MCCCPFSSRSAWLTIRTAERSCSTIFRKERGNPLFFVPKKFEKIKNNSQKLEKRY
jgi:hypothetical protein